MRVVYSAGYPTIYLVLLHGAQVAVRRLGDGEDVGRQLEREAARVLARQLALVPASQWTFCVAGGLPKRAVLMSRVRRSGLRLEAASGGPAGCNHTGQASLQPAHGYSRPMSWKGLTLSSTGPMVV